MKHIVKIAFLMLGAVMILTSCDRNRHTPDPGAQAVPISFSALSQIPSVKADDGTTPLSEYHEDFGVWGIARHSLYSPYILWETSAQTPMIKVEAVHEKDADGKDLPTSNFVPTSGAYWVQGYTYSFIAIAPYPSGDDAFSGLVATPDANSTAHDSFSFTIDMGKKYAPTAENVAADFDFDRMGAAARSAEVEIASKQEAQILSFNHLLTKLCVKVRFNPAEGTVTGMRLVNVDTEADYEIALNADNTTLDVIHKITSPATQMTVDFTENHFEEDEDTDGQIWQVATVHLLPQNIGDFELYLDFEVGGVQTNNFKVNIDAAKTSPNSPVYDDNEWDNWNLVISPKGIAFDVEVVGWGDGGADEFPID